VTLPADARATGYRLGAIEIYVSPSDQDEAYVVSPRDAERWPRVDPVRLERGARSSSDTFTVSDRGNCPAQ